MSGFEHHESALCNMKMALFYTELFRARFGIPRGPIIKKHIEKSVPFMYCSTVLAAVETAMLQVFGECIFSLDKNCSCAIKTKFLRS